MSQPMIAILMALTIAQSGLLLHAAVHDVAARTIPNASCLVLAGLGLLQRALRHQLIGSVAVAALVFAGGAVLWRRGWLGGGDVKLATACACVVPPTEVPAMLAAIMVGGGLLACIYLLAMRCTGRAPANSARPAGLLGRVARLELWRVRRRAALPYGVAISAGALLHIYGA